jgi:N-acylneuraminate cytidylyltransferase
MKCILLARGGSKGIPKKNIIDFNGQPLISYSILQALKSKYITNVYVSSDSDEILKVSESYGALSIKRPDSISDDTSSSEDALKHALGVVGSDDLFETVIFMQVTSPLRTTQDIDNAIETLLTNDYDSVFSACKLEDFLIWENKNGILNSVNYDYKKRVRRQDSNPQFVENGSIYVFRKNILINNNNRLGGRIGISLMESWKMFEIDSYEDLELCKLLYKNKLYGEYHE